MDIRKSNISFITFVITFFSFNLNIVNGWGGGSPPSPSEVSNMVNSKWQASEFSELETYITNLYSSFPDYIPAKLASIFHDVVYQGHLSDAMQKFNQVKQWVEQHPGVVSEDFITQMYIIEWTIQSEIDMYTRKGISEEQLQPDPSAVKAAYGDDPLPLIKILEYCDFAEESLPWYDSDWDYRKKITIQNANVDSDLNNFPLYVKIASDSDIGAHAQADGDDIRFTQSDGTTSIPYEKEAFSVNSGNAEGHFWVKIPTISSGSTTDIYIYYGNSEAVNGEDAANVWDDSFELVHHCAEDLWDGTAGEVKDSTSNAYHGIRVGDATTTSDGKIGRGGTFDGDDYVSSGDATVSGNFTLSFWSLNNNTLEEEESGWYGYPIIKTSADFCMGWQGWTDGWSLSFQDSTDTRKFTDSMDKYITADTWYYIVGTYDGTNLRIYRDSDLIRGPVNVGSYTLIHNGSSVYTGYQWNGLVDEVRISSTDRSGSWIKFEYYNISESANELTWEAEEAR